MKKLKEPIKSLQVRIELIQWQILASMAVKQNRSVSDVVRDALAPIIGKTKE